MPSVNPRDVLEDASLRCVDERGRTRGLLLRSVPPIGSSDSSARVRVQLVEASYAFIDPSVVNFLAAPAAFEVAGS